MCGIAGIVHFDGRPVDDSVLRAMVGRLRHRGPDDWGVWTGRCGAMAVGLAHTRLAVIDPSPEAAQPMHHPEAPASIVFNGEVFNYRALREELVRRGEVCRTGSDTEVLLRWLVREGPEALVRANGMWALAWVDRAAGRGLLGRDRYGIKPLFYLADSRRLVFASEIKALLVLDDWEREIDVRALGYYLRLGYVPHPRTIFARVRRVEPGCAVAFDESGVKPPQRWYALPRPAPYGGTYADACRELEARIGEAVREHTVADVPVGAFLSGGVDSSVVVCHLGGHAAEPVRTFSLGYAGEARYDETRYAERVAARAGTVHETFRVGLAEVEAEIGRLIDHLDEPLADSSLIPTSLVSRLARREVKVALSGDGGDELFGGYWRYRGHAWWRRYRAVPASLRRGVIEPLVGRLPVWKGSALGNRVRQMRKLLRAGGDDALVNHLRWAEIVDAAAVEVLGEAFARTFDDGWIAAWWREQAGIGGPARLDDILRLDLLVTLPGDMLWKVDQASMRHGLEVRVPLLDPRVVEFALSLPVAWKMDGRGKRILRDAHAGRVPGEVLRRPKMGFEVPVGEFLRGGLREMFFDIVTRDVVERFPGLRFEAVQAIYARHASRRGEYADFLYAVMVLCAWWRRWGASCGAQT